MNGTNEMNETTRTPPTVRLAAACLAAVILVTSGCARPLPKGDDPALRTGATRDMPDALREAGFTTMASLINDAALTGGLREPGPFTVFAPTNEAFAKMPPSELEALRKDRDKLFRLLAYHVVYGRVTSPEIFKLTSMRTNEGGLIRVAVVNGKPLLNERTAITRADLAALNGVIHGIDGVLMPK
jgi:uncharacterized surface protein with fasciclin (FAS1) repeats